MNKELGRKITSLTLMTIMLTWTASMGFSGSFMMPEAEAANQYLWVSAEDAGGSKFYGGQVLEIVVTDPAINRLDEAYGMPDVTIDGKKIIMAQGVDGSWYAYIADGKKATTIDKNYAEVEDGRGADYGRWCKNDVELSFAPYATSQKNVAEPTSLAAKPSWCGIATPRDSDAFNVATEFAPLESVGAYSKGVPGAQNLP